MGSPRNPASPYRVPYFLISTDGAVPIFSNGPPADDLDYALVVSPVILLPGLYSVAIEKRFVHIHLPQAPPDLGGPPPCFFLLPESDAHPSVLRFAHTPIRVSLAGSPPAVGIKQTLWGETATAILSMWELVTPVPNKTGSFRIVSPPMTPRFSPLSTTG